MALTQVKAGGLTADLIDETKLADNSIDSEHYNDGSIDHEHLANDCIDGDNIQDDVVNSEHIAAGAIDLEHMSSESVDEDNLHISNAGSDGQFLSKQSGNSGGLTWASISSTPEGTAILSTGESGGSKFLREDGDGSCSWQTISTPDADKIIEGDTKVEAVDSGSGGYLEATIDNTARQRLHKVGDYGHYELKNSTVLTNSDTIYTAPNGDYILYVSDTGNDSTGNGTASAPYRSVVKAWQQSPVLQGNGNIIIRIADDYTDTGHMNFYGKTQAGQGTVVFQGITSLTDTSAHQVVVNKTSNAYNWKFHDVDVNLRFENIKWEGGSSGGGNMCFYRCKYVYIKNSCAWETNTQGGWSNGGGLLFNRVQYVDNRLSSVACNTNSTAGLGGLIIYEHSRGYHNISVTKTGTKFGNHAVVVKDGSFMSGSCSVNNFATGISIGLNHYGAESAGFYVANGGTIQNCTNGVSLFYGSHWRQYSQSFSSNTTNINNASGGFSG